MNRKGIRLVAPLALATAATMGLGLSQPAQAADTTGETQLVTSDQLGDLYHTVRHADGIWQAPGNVESATGGGTVGEWVTIAGV
jgi:hypothetical protein